MARLNKILGIILLLFCSVFACNRFVAGKGIDDIKKAESVKQLKSLEEIQSTVNIIKSELPKKVDKNTTFKWVEYIQKENRLVFYFDVEGLPIKERSELEVLEITKKLKVSQLAYIKNSPNNRTFVNAQVVFSYIYTNINGNLFLKYEILPEEYN